MTDQSIHELLAETKRLRERLEQTQPDSARLSILIRDERRLTRLVGAA